MALTNAERQRRFREKRDADPQRREKYIQMGKERYRKDVESGKQKPVSELNERAKRAIRKRWREQKRKDRLKMKQNKLILQNVQTPPESPDEDQSRRRKDQNRKKKKKNQAKVYRDKKKLELEVKFLKKKLDAYRKRISRSQEEIKPKDTPRKRTRKLLRLLTPKETKRCLFKSQVIIEAIRKKYQEKKKKEKESFSKFICNNTLKKYKLKTETYKHVNCYSSAMKKPRTYKTISKLLGNRIHSFYLRNDNSRLIAGKRQTKTLKKERKQRRVLLHNLKTLHQKFVSEENTKISYSAFCRLRPFYVTFPRQSDRNTCMCKICNNTEMMAEALKKAKLFDTDNVNDLLEEVVCDLKSRKCMYNECEIFANKRPKNNKSVKDEEVTWYEWKTKREVRTIKRSNTTTEKIINITVKESQIGTVETLFDKFEVQLKRYMKHLFRTCHQYHYFAKRKSDIKNDECLLHIDFSENYLCGYKSEIQSVHFGGSKKQLTLHTGVAYVKDQEPLSFCTVSDSLIHGPEAVWAHLQPIVTDIRHEHPHIRKMEIFSDGPVTQYRQKGNFYLASVKGRLNGFEDVTWSFFESGHGKGVPDAIGGAVKRQADNFVKYGGDIISAEMFCSAISKDSKVKMYVVEDTSIEDAKRLLENVVLKPVPGTMNLHQVKCCVNSGQIAYRNLSCHCVVDKEHEGHCFEKATIVNGADTKIKPNPTNLETDQIINQTDKPKPRPPSRGEVYIDTTDVSSPYGNDRKRKINENLKQGMKKQAKKMPKKNETNMKSVKPRKPHIKEQSSRNEKSVKLNKYYQDMLLDLNKCESFDELKNRMCIVPNLNETGNVNHKSIYRNQLEVNYDSLIDIPEDFGNSNLYPVEVNTDGNCLPSCGSVFAFGTPDRTEELRTHIIKELCENEDYYLKSKNMEKGLSDTHNYNLPSQYAQYSEYFLPGVHLTETIIRDIFRKEVMSLTKNRSYMGIWQIFALSSILKTPIQSVYPDKGNPNVRRDLNRLIWPRTEPEFKPISILWTNTRDDIPKEHWIPNHFVPLLPFEIEPEQVTTSQSSENIKSNKTDDTKPTDINNNTDTPEAQENLNMMTDSGKPNMDVIIHLPEIDKCLNKYVILNFNGTPYPGFVKDIENGELEVLCMHKVGRKKDTNHFFWPQKMKDLAWYSYSDIITLIPKPIPVENSRHFLIDKMLFECALKICK